MPGNGFRSLVHFCLRHNWIWGDVYVVNWEESMLALDVWRWLEARKTRITASFSSSWTIFGTQKLQATKTVKKSTSAAFDMINLWWDHNAGIICKNSLNPLTFSSLRTLLGEHNLNLRHAKASLSLKAFYRTLNMHCCIISILIWRGANSVDAKIL